MTVGVFMLWPDTAIAITISQITVNCLHAQPTELGSISRISWHFGVGIGTYNSPPKQGCDPGTSTLGGI